MNNLRAILAGCGSMGNGWCRVVASRDDIEIVALVDISPDAASAFAARQRPRRAPLRVACRRARPQSSRTSSSTPPSPRRAEPLRERPWRRVATCSRKSRSRRRSARPANCSPLPSGPAETHAIMQNRRYLAGTRGMRQLIADGVIGDVGMICSDFFLGAHFGGFPRRDGERVAARHGDPHVRPGPGSCPGWTRPRHSATSSTCPDPGSSGNASALVVFEMDGGARYCYRGSWSAEGARTSWEAEWRIIGSRGTAVWNGVDAPYAEIPDGDGFLRSCRRVETDC